ncbi:Actin cytoskeleton-regulatory complex protein [Heracleum sosnowskyi]|uniref:Actin cytoskeleton-regulatory complex protein n=1 Tax=Heracleum sosnowskyi TaxID=360622 RepID=A0AAD8I277_9APIA|nr:Actin cytoskeleton-regulatory complex protein [Heracleum sosnowskyi]
MQADLEIRSSSPSLFVHEDEEKEFAEIAAKISEDFDFKLSFLKLTSEQGEDDSEEVEEERNEEREVAADDDFTFAINGSDSTVISGQGAATEAQIRPYFPLFNQDLLLSPEDYKRSENKLPSRPPVEKVFIESPPSEGESNAVNRIASGPYCEWEKATPELSKKSNSTGFSKLWRFKEYLHRSHSDGRDAFVFLNNEAKREVKSVPKKLAGEASSEKKPVAGEKKAVKKGKKTAPPLSAHEVYLRSKGIYPDYDRRRSHLPFQPVGFFTNVSGGGLSKNVHPY